MAAALLGQTPRTPVFCPLPAHAGCRHRSGSGRRRRRKGGGPGRRHGKRYSPGCSCSPQLHLRPGRLHEAENVVPLPTALRATTAATRAAAIPQVHRRHFISAPPPASSPCAGHRPGRPPGSSRRLRLPPGPGPGRRQRTGAVPAMDFACTAGPARARVFSWSALACAPSAHLCPVGRTILQQSLHRLHPSASCPAGHLHCLGPGTDSGVVAVQLFGRSLLVVCPVPTQLCSCPPGSQRYMSSACTPQPSAAGTTC